MNLKDPLEYLQVRELALPTRRVMDQRLRRLPQDLVLHPQLRQVPLDPAQLVTQLSERD